MTDYLAIVRKLDFVDLFKYGHFIINNAIPFNGDIASHSDDNELFDALTSKMNMYEYSFEYIIIHFVSDSNNNQYFSIDIEDVRNLYTFDEEAKKEMSVSFDSRIQLCVSPWADKFLKLQQKLSIKQSMRGVKNLWAIFNLPKSDLPKCKAIITQDVVQEVFRELYAYERPFGEKSIWTYLLRYERHSFYPKGMIGFFCDFIHVFCNFLEKQELCGEVAESTQLYPQFKACQKPRFELLLKIVKSSPVYQKTKQATGCRFAIAAPLFLYLKAEFADGMAHKPREEFINYSKEIGGFECSIAIYLLGIALGYDKTYDAFYESEQLPFFKKPVVREVPSKINDGLENVISRFPEPSEEPGQDASSSTENDDKSQKDSKATIILSTDSQNPKSTYKQKELFTVDDDANEGQNRPILWMKKRQNKTKADVCPVFDEEKRSELEKLGYKPVARFDTTVKDVITSYGYNPDEEKARLKKSKNK